MLRTECAGCGSRRLETFLDLGESPLADRFPAAPGDEPRFPLRVAVCELCLLMQLLDVVDDADLYGGDYAFLTGSSPASVAYFASFAEWCGRTFPQQCEGSVVEIACNDGTLLQHFEHGRGVEPAGPAAEAARAKGLDVIGEPFTEALAKDMGEGSAHLVLACNVAAHVADPVDFLSGIRRLLHPGGFAVVEFQYAGDFLAGCQFDHVYHEHRFFYSLTSFSRVAARAGLKVRSWERTPAQGGSVRVTLRADGPVAWFPEEAWLRDKTPYRAFQGRVNYSATRLRSLLQREAEAGRTVAGYGATAKSATLLNYAVIGPELLPWIEDLTPGKIGRYAPGTGIPVVAPDDRPRPDAYLLLAWNYLGSVMRREQEFLKQGGRFIVPGPVPVML